MTDLSQLDGPELLHLALEAARRDDHGAAITYLKQAVDLPEGRTSTSTDYAKLLYLLGAEYAQIGLMDRAQEYMGRSLEVDPDLHTARLQLGLLHLTCAQVQPSIDVLTPFAALGEESPFRHLGDGLLHLIRDEFEACRVSLLKGMDLNSRSATPNLALNGDMQKILAALPGADGSTPPTPDAAQADASAEAGFLMSAYSRGQGQVN